MTKVYFHDDNHEYDYLSKFLYKSILLNQINAFHMYENGKSAKHYRLQ